jgi:hypothetical protein
MTGKMAYAYRSTGGKVMSEDREKVLRMALKAVLIAAVDQGLDLDALTEAAVESMLNDIAYMSEDVAQAVIAIEVAADALAVE